MPALVVGGVTIPIAVSSPSFSRLDAVDRGRMFDNTYYASQTGGAAREWDFSTPPVTTTDAATYSAVLGKVASQLCSGDILELPTMCCAEYTGGTLVRLAVGHRVVLNFRLHEVQPERSLLEYDPGDVVTGEAFTRSTIAYYVNGLTSPPLTQSAINVKRDLHVASGVYSLLLEDARTNSMLRANDFSHAAWTKSNCTIGTGIADPVGGTTACTLTATASSGYCLQNLGAGASLVRTNSIWLKRRTGTGAFNLYDPSQVNPLVCALTANWQRFFRIGSASTNRDLTVLFATSGDAVDAWCAQQEDGAFATSEIPTTTVAVTRGADTYSLPFTTPPQEMTAYAKFVEGGTLQVSGRVCQISDAANNVPAFRILSSGAFYAAQHQTTLGTVTSTLAAAPAMGDVVELMARLYGDGSVDITQSLNAGTATTATQTAALTFAPAWSGLLCYLNSAGTAGAYGFTALQEFEIVSGVRSLTEMRAL